MSTKPLAAFLINDAKIPESVYGHGRKERVAERCRIYPERITAKNFHEHTEQLREVEYAFSTWSMPTPNDEMLSALPNLKALFYAAGSVQYFARPFLHRGVRIFSGWAANAIPVAEFAMSQILLSCKGYFRNSLECRIPGRWKEKSLHAGEGIYGNTVALLGLGMIGRHTARLLQPFGLRLLAYDPFAPASVFAEYGLESVGLDEAFATAQVVSNHIANLPATVGMLDGKYFRQMPPYATFINTGRGQQVNEGEMIAVLRERPDLTALLDVTWPEPPALDSPLYTLRNVQLSGHIAGSIGREVLRMTDFMLEEFDRVQRGEPTRYEVTLEMLETMA
jgi:phosphoglycerate dehydrogenase-like enzyme